MDTSPNRSTRTAFSPPCGACCAPARHRGPFHLKRIATVRPVAGGLRRRRYGHPYRPIPPSPRQAWIRRWKRLSGRCPPGRRGGRRAGTVNLTAAPSAGHRHCRDTDGFGDRRHHLRTHPGRFRRRQQGCARPDPASPGAPGPGAVVSIGSQSQRQRSQYWRPCPVRRGRGS
jgi:hypothetical protein